MADARLDHSWQLDRAIRRRTCHAAPTAIHSPCSDLTTRTMAASSGHFCQAPHRSKFYAVRTARCSRELEAGREADCSKTSFPSGRRIGCESIGPTPCRRPKTPTRSVSCWATSIFILFNEGRHFELAHCLGAQALTIDGVSGVRFAVWAPNATRVAVVGDFNSWDRATTSHAGAPWCRHLGTIRAAARAGHRIINTTSSVPAAFKLPWKADPVARQTEMPPSTASVVPQPDRYVGTTTLGLPRAANGRRLMRRSQSTRPIWARGWRRGERDNRHACGTSPSNGWCPTSSIWALPMSSCFRSQNIRLAAHGAISRLACSPPALGSGHRRDMYVLSMRCMPPASASFWIGCPRISRAIRTGLARFDGTALYEHLDPREGFHHDWNTYIYNFGRREVQGFLIASALYWLEHFHVDGLRVDAVASMLYRDYSRRQGEWVPNIYGGRENLEAIGFLRHLNAVVAERCPGAIMVAEEFDCVARRQQADLGRRARLLLQMEYGMDARHLELHD